MVHAKRAKKGAEDAKIVEALLVANICG